MKTNIIYLFSFLLIVCLIIIDSIYNPLISYTSGAPSGYTGSPGDGRSCTKSVCHGGTATPTDGIISTNVGSNGYYSNEVYQITISFSQTGIQKFGFEASPQDENGIQKGTFSLIDAAKTKLLNSGKYITHTSNGTSGNETINWTFNWHPPFNIGQGDAVIYVAINATNGNNSSTGDKIYLSSLTIPEAPDNIPSDIKEISAVNLTIISAYPNPFNHFTEIPIPTDYSADKVFHLYSLQGNLVKIININEDQQIIRLYKEDLNKGIYFFNISTPSKNLGNGKLEVL